MTVASRLPKNWFALSSQFDNAVYWNQVAATVTPNIATAPDGTLTAYRLNGTGVGNQRIDRTANDADGSVFVCLSLYAKQGTTAATAFQITDVGTGVVLSLVTFNLAAGTLVATQGNGRMTSVGNGWYLCEAFNTDRHRRPSSSLTSLIFIDSPTWTATNFYVWQAQLNSGIYADGYWPTTEVPRT